MNQVYLGDCIEVMKDFQDNSIDAICCDPPYGLSFMGKKWDYDVPSIEIWEECLRVLKPGGYLLAFAGTRTQHRMAVRIEDAGFEIRDMIAWVYSTGFPKSLNLFKQLKKECTCGNMEAYEQGTKALPEHDLRPVSEADLPQEVHFDTKQGEVLFKGVSEQGVQIQQSEPTENVWEGQPSMERWSDVETNSRELSGDNLCAMSEGVSADGKERRLHNATQAGDGATSGEITDENGSGASRRPQSSEQPDRESCTFCKQYFAQAVRAYGLGSALKPAFEPITIARKPISEKNLAANYLKWGVGGINIDGCRIPTQNEELGRNNNARTEGTSYVVQKETMRIDNSGGQRFPVNLIHDGSDEVVSLFPNSKSTGGKNIPTNDDGSIYSNGLGGGIGLNAGGLGDSGSASRFFYCAKASKSERNKGCEGLEEKVTTSALNTKNGAGERLDGSPTVKHRNNHPTVKPIALMEYLVKLISREGAIVLDPFAGSGTTGIACKNLNRNYILIEKEKEYIDIINKRLEQCTSQNYSQK